MTAPNGSSAEEQAPGQEKTKSIIELADDEIQAVAKLLTEFRDKKAAEFEEAASKPPLLKRLAPRLLACLVVGVALLSAVALLAPQQLGVILYKACLLTLAGYGGYWLDRWVFPYARPDGYLAKTWQTVAGATQDGADYAVAAGYELVFALACLRRGLIMFAAIVGMGLGL